MSPSGKLRIERVFASHHKYTFRVKPVKKLLAEEMNGGIWLDPMSGYHSPADVTNDINPDTPAQHHEDALEFLKKQPHAHYDGILFDPPYSFENAKKIYALQDKPFMQRGIVPFYNYIRQCRKALVPLVKPNGKIILFGYDSMGMGKRNGFLLERVLIIPMGWCKIDIIVTVDRKVQTTL